MRRLSKEEKAELKEVIKAELSKGTSLDDISELCSIPKPVVRYYADKMCLLEYEPRDRLTEDMKDFIRQTCSTNKFLHSKEVTQMMNEKFGTDFEYHCVRSLIVREELKSKDGITKETAYMYALNEEAKEMREIEEEDTYIERVMREPQVRPYYVKSENKTYYDVSEFYGI